MNRLLLIPILSLMLLAIDLYAWQAIRAAFQHSSASVYKWASFIYWGFAAFVILGIFAYNFLPLNLWRNEWRTLLMGAVMVSFSSKLILMIFLFIEDLSRVFRWGWGQSKQWVRPQAEPLDAINRSAFLSKAALGLATVPAISATVGILSGAHDYRIEPVTLNLPHLPKEFDGLSIAQISDVHSGSFFNKRAVQGGVELLMRQKPDMVFFTGDLVNNTADEFEDYFPVFNKIKAPLGVYATLGNHDYGDYVRWKTPAAKRQNLQNLMEAHRLMQWQLLNDRNVILKESGESLAILGVQNIGVGRFPWYGNLAKAYAGSEEVGTKLLLSHDPTHWNAEVTQKFPDIDVMFSGHTHGAQFGVKVAGLQWSPAQYVYKQWAGWYQEGKQQLYVNRGYGYIGYPGRVGMPPEITIFTLKKS